MAAKKVVARAAVPERATAKLPDVPEEWLDGFLRASGLTPLPQGKTGEFEARFTASLMGHFHRSFLRLHEAGVDPVSLGDPEQLAERIAASAPLEPSPLAELTGPFYDTTGLRTWLNVTRQALLDRVKAKTLLGMADGGQNVGVPRVAVHPGPGHDPAPHRRAPCTVLRICGPVDVGFVAGSREGSAAGSGSSAR